MSNHIKVLLVGVGYMGREYMKVLKDMDIETIVVGRGKGNAEKFQVEFSVPVITGGIDFIKKENIQGVTHAIIAVPVKQLCESAKKVVSLGIRSILLEKPGGLYVEEMNQLSESAKQKGTSIYIAYNRRYYASTKRAIEIINEDGGVSSYNFEFTEWGHIARDVLKARNEKTSNDWFLGNSTHVVDLAFFLGGIPKEMSCYTAGSLDWYPNGCIYSGAGISDKGALFSYQANWSAPGRWGVEILTNKHRLIFKPLEELQIQELGSVKIEKGELDDQLDQEYKPGLYRQTKAFLYNEDDGIRKTLEEQIDHMGIYRQMEPNGILGK